MLEAKQSIIQQLQADILEWQGIYIPKINHSHLTGLEVIEKAFPNALFPIGALHEFVCAEQEHRAACGGFIAGLLASLIKDNGLCLWISTSRQLFPPALAMFGIQPDHVLFVDAATERDVLWATEEGLKCRGITAVITEIATFTVAQTRRLQLAAEQHHSTCFLLRNCVQGNRASLCAARWQITPMPSKPLQGMPGVGLPRWEVELLKVRNGTPGKWMVEWSSGIFTVIAEQQNTVKHMNRKVG
ncbi:ImuA family protein [Mucilaginibacter koreensis]